MAAEHHWWDIFAFARDGLTGSELLGMVMVLGMVIIMFVVQYGQKNAAKRVDFSWIFMDSVTGKVSRSGMMTFGGFLLGCWAVVDAQSSGKLDWSFFGVFLSYCAGVRVIEKWNPSTAAPQQSVSKRTTQLEETLIGDDAAPPSDEKPLPVRVANKNPIATREANPLKKKGGMG
jgi:hypothetical protein